MVSWWDATWGVASGCCTATLALLRASPVLQAAAILGVLALVSLLARFFHAVGVAATKTAPARGGAPPPPPPPPTVPAIQGYEILDTVRRTERRLKRLDDSKEHVERLFTAAYMLGLTRGQGRAGMFVLEEEEVTRARARLAEYARDAAADIADDIDTGADAAREGVVAAARHMSQETFQPDLGDP